MRIRLCENRPILVITGPESSGKTTLALKLVQRYGLAYLPEYARTYFDTHPYTGYSADDVVAIAKIQDAMEAEAIKTQDHLICDTDYITNEIWMRERFDQMLPWPIPRVNKKVYLLLRPDIAWTADPLRENPHDRDRLFDLHVELLEQYQCTYHIVGRSLRSTISLDLD